MALNICLFIAFISSSVVVFFLLLFLLSLINSLVDVLIFYSFCVFGKNFFELADYALTIASFNFSMLFFFSDCSKRTFSIENHLCQSEDAKDFFLI